MQLKRPELAAGVGPGPGRGRERGGRGEGLRKLVSTNTNTCGVKASENCRVSMVTELRVGYFFSVKTY